MVGIVSIEKGEEFSFTCVNDGGKERLHSHVVEEKEMVFSFANFSFSPLLLSLFSIFLKHKINQICTFKLQLLNLQMKGSIVH